MRHFRHQSAPSPDAGNVAYKVTFIDKAKNRVIGVKVGQTTAPAAEEKQQITVNLEGSSVKDKYDNNYTIENTELTLTETTEDGVYIGTADCTFTKNETSDKQIEPVQTSDLAIVNGGAFSRCKALTEIALPGIPKDNEIKGTDEDKTVEQGEETPAYLDPAPFGAYYASIIYRDETEAAQTVQATKMSYIIMMRMIKQIYRVMI